MLSFAQRRIAISKLLKHQAPSRILQIAAMSSKKNDIDMTDHEHHQHGAAPAKPEDIGLTVAQKKGNVEEKGKHLGEGEGAHDEAVKKSSNGDKKL